MMKRLLTFAILAGTLALHPVPAAAQFQPASTRPTGENYHVELYGGFWSPVPELFIASEGLGIVGTEIDAVADLGVSRTRFREFRLALRPATKHRFRLQYVPVQYDSEAVLTRSVVFNGIRYTVGLPVASQLVWKTWRMGYEYDFIYRDRGFIGFIAEAKYTDVDVSLFSLIGDEFARARAPIPALGGIGRVYVADGVSVTFEMTGIKVPERIDEDIRARYLDWDLYTVLNFSDHAGFQLGYRSIDVNYRFDLDSGDFKLKGLYFGGVARF